MPNYYQSSSVYFFLFGKDYYFINWKLSHYMRITKTVETVMLIIIKSPRLKPWAELKNNDSKFTALQYRLRSGILRRFLAYARKLYLYLLYL